MGRLSTDFLWLFLASALLAASSTAAPPTDVWLDVDPANGVGEVDDGLMMIQAFHSPEVLVHGVSVVYGNAPLEQALPIARDIAARFGPPGLVVAGGASSKEQLGTPTDAVRALSEALRARPLTLLAVGPLTNIGTLLQREPHLASRIQKLVIVAGRRPEQRFFVSSRPLSDFNFEHDPAAMQVILDSKVPIWCAPWEVSSKVWITRDDLGLWRAAGSPTGLWLAESLPPWLERWEKNIGPWGFNPFDSLGLLMVTHPDLIEAMPASLRIQPGTDYKATVEQRTAGATIPHLVATPDAGSPHRYAFRPQRAARGVIVRRLPGPLGQKFANDADLSAPAPSFDHTAWDKVLKRFVNPAGGVDYAALKRDPSGLNQYLDSLADAPLERLPRDEQLALFINAYNACTLRLIIDHYPLASIRDISEARRWKAERWKVARRTASLDQIEHLWIRPTFGDPRIHFALVCAAVDCPPLRDEAYDGLRLDEQLEDQTRRVHGGQRWLRYDAQVDPSSLQVTSLYDWYGQDFLLEAIDVPHYVARYVPAVAQRLAARQPLTLTYIKYDWSLNSSDALR